MEKEIIIEVLNHMLNFIELYSIESQKVEAVKSQKYDTAFELRGRELELRKFIPKKERLIELRDSLDKIKDN